MAESLQPRRNPDNRLAKLNDERDVILSDVATRLIGRYTTGSMAALRDLLAEAVHHEVRRLDKAGKQRTSQGHFWHNLARRLKDLGDSEVVAEVTGLINHYARDIVGNFDPRVYRFVSRILPPAMSFLFSPVRSLRGGLGALQQFGDRLLVEGDLELIKECFRKGRVILTPTHSSNMDSIMLGLGMEKIGLPPVTYGAGKNLFTNPVISFFMRNLGAYRVDRRLQFRLYKDVLKEYSTVLIERGFHSLFFPGGTRCRSNLLESKLKLGLLGTGVAAYRHHLQTTGEPLPVFVIPVTINYRLVLEAETLIEDSLAEEKNSRYIIEDDEFSRVGRWVEFIRKMLTMNGAVIVRFGTPMDIVGNLVDEDCQPRDFRGRPNNTEEYFKNRDGVVDENVDRERQYTALLGQGIAGSFRDCTMLQDTNVISRVMFDEGCRLFGTDDIYTLIRLSPEEVVMDLSELRRRVEHFCEQLPSGTVFKGGRSTQVFVQDGLQALQTYHSREVISRMGQSVAINDWKLLYYYQNRTRFLDMDHA